MIGFRPPLSIIVILGLLSFLQTGFAAPDSSEGLGDFEAGLLMDHGSGRILWSRNPDSSVIPASLTKMVTLHLAWVAVETGKTSLDTVYSVPAHTSASAMAPGSSLMFLEPGMPVTLLDLMRGLAVDSGNDAAETLAALLAPTRDDFLSWMNREAAALGGTGLQFFDPAGLDPRNRITPREFGRFLRAYLDLHPQATESLHGLETFTFPPASLRGFRTRPITQANRNLLVGTYPGADGLKTGYIPEAGYHLAATALRQGQRLTALVLGVRAGSTSEGSRRRSAAAVRLLDWGYTHYPLTPLPMPPLPKVRTYYSLPPQGDVVAETSPSYPLKASEIDRISVGINLPSGSSGPWKAGQQAGSLHWYLDNKEIAAVSLKALASHEEAPWWTKAWDWVEILLGYLSGKPSPEEMHLSIVN